MSRWTYDERAMQNVGGQTDAERTSPPWRRRVVVGVLVWLVLVAATVGLHRVAWHATPGAWSPGEEVWTKHASNALQVGSLPGWLVAKFLHLWLQRTTAAVIAASVGWGMWVAAAWGLLWLSERRQHRLPARDEPGSSEEVNASRRVFLGRAVASCGMVGVGGASVVGAVVNPLDLRVARYRVAVQGLPPELERLRIVQLTDLHLGPRVPAEMVRYAVRIACELGADVFALTGDYVERVDGNVDRLPDLLRPLVRAARIGCVGVLGNHDHYGNWRLVDAALRSAGLQMIDNGRVFVDAATRELVTEPPDRGLCLAGVQDWSEAHTDVDAALSGVPAAMPRLVLSHNPDVAEYCIAARHRVDLLICGHTHGGQVRLPLLGSVFIPSAFGDKYRHGLVNGPHCRVLISAGVGLTVMPIRIGVPPEIVEITLVRE